MLAGGPRLQSDHPHKMSLPLFYESAGGINLDSGTVTLEGGEAGHLSRSLRAREGDEVLVGDGAGGRYRVKLGSVTRDLVEGSIESAETTEPEVPRLVLYQALARPAKMDEVVQRAAESGVSSLVPFVSPRSGEGSERLASSRILRWRKIALEASEVARRAWPLIIGDPLVWPLGSSHLREQELSILLWESESGRGLAGVLPESPPRSIGIIVGPEGGFAEEEAALLSSAGASPVGMGDLILRTESAGSSAAMLIRFHNRHLEPGGPRGGE